MGKLKNGILINDLDGASFKFKGNLIKNPKFWPK